MYIICIHQGVIVHFQTKMGNIDLNVTKAPWNSQ